MVDKELFVLKREKFISFVDQCGQKLYFEIDPPSENINELIFT